MDNYSKGLASFGIPLLGSGIWPRTGFGGAGPQTYPGGDPKGSNIFFVNSAVGGAADSRGQGITPTRPFKTLNFALTQTTANNGDLIFCGPGHVETVATAGGLSFPNATAAGVTVVFEGNAITDRAQINFATSTAAQVTILANGVTLIGAFFYNTIDALVAGISVTGADCTLIDTQYRDGPATNSLIGLAMSNVRHTLNGYRYYEDKTGGGTAKTEHIRVVGGDHHRFQDCHVTGNFSTGCWNNITTLSTELLFKDCSFNNLNSTPHVAIAILTTSTGFAEGVSLTVASGSTWLTASNKLVFDGASVAAIPGGVFAHPNG